MPSLPLGTNITKEELAKHNKPDDMWISIYGRVYDLNKVFANTWPVAGPISEKTHVSVGNHPKDLLKYSGKDSTVEFFEAHPVPEFLLKTESIGTLVLTDCEREVLGKKIALIEFTETLKLGLKELVDEYFTNYTEAQKKLILGAMTTTLNNVRDKYIKKLDDDCSAVQDLEQNSAKYALSKL
jgi:hypothetical protein